MKTITLVLDEDAPVLDSDQDVHDLVLMLRGHVMQLGPAAHTMTGPLAEALSAAQDLSAREMPAEYVQARAHLRKLAATVQALLAEMRAAGVLCAHHPECPSAEASDGQAAQVRVHRPEAGWSVLCNGMLLFDDTGCLRPDGVIVKPSRPLPSAQEAPQAVSR
ncbi:DUF5999 family protein [Streptomyces agglomeratus]|uniref:DUF5999 family protein n=1 Tax=Streptomyces agglomeratus TaxID=285458 RepID=UPI003F7334B4